MEPAGFGTTNNEDSPINPLGAHNAPLMRDVSHFDADDGWSLQTEPITGEAPLTIFVNDAEFATVLCSPWDLESIAIGFLCSEGILRDRETLGDLTIDAEKGIAAVRIEGYEESVAGKVFLKRYMNSCCGRSRASFYYSTDAMLCKTVESRATVDGATAVGLMYALSRHAELFKLTGGVHCALLADGGSVLAFHEDIGRNNVLDRIYGRCFLDGTPTEGKTIVFSGRVSSEVVLKLSKMQVPILISHSAPSTLALQLADQLGITVLGFTRGNRFNLYTHPERVSDAPAQV